MVEINTELNELKVLFPASKEIELAGRKIVLKPMVWSDFLMLIEDFGKVVVGIRKESPDFKFEDFDEKDLGKLVPVIAEVLNIFARWLNVELSWLKSNLTMKGTAQILLDFLEVNEWEEVKALFLALKLKVRKEVQK